LETTRVLIVAHKTAATPPLLEAVRERVARGPCRFTLLVPKATHGLARLADPEDVPEDETRDVLALALPLLEDAAGAPVEGIVGDANPLNAVCDAINLRGFDEIILSTLPTRVSRWVRLDLPHKIAALGVPVTTVTAKEGRAPAAAGPA